MTKTGTILCWLFGHKFVKEITSDGQDFDGNITPGVCWNRTAQLNYCVRCGIDRSTTGNQVETTLIP